MKNLFVTIKSNVLFIVLLLWITLPYFAYNQIFRIAALFSIIIIIIKYFKLGNKNTFYLIFFFIIYTVFLNTIASDSAYLLRHLQLYIFLALIYLSSIVMQFNPKKKQQLLLIILSLNIIALLGTYLGLLMDPHVARALSKSGEGAIELTEKGIGGYGTVYMNAVIYPILLFIIKTTKNKWVKYFAWINLVCAILVIINSNYLIAILLSLFQLLYLVLNSFKVGLKIILVAPFFLFILYALNNIDYIEKATYPFVEGTSLRFKHEDIFNQLRGNESENGSIDIRKERYERSLKLSFVNPITGVLSFDDVGKHSNILDIFAQFGFFLGFLVIFFLRQLPLLIRKRVTYKYKHYFQCFLWAIIILGLFNNYFMQLGIVYILLACIVNFNDKRLYVIL